MTSDATPAMRSPSIHFMTVRSVSILAKRPSYPASSSAAARALSSGAPAATSASYVLESITAIEGASLARSCVPQHKYRRRSFLIQPDRYPAGGRPDRDARGEHMLGFLVRRQTLALLA